MYDIFIEILVLLSILALLYDPNPNSPLLDDVNTVFKNDKALYL